VVDLDRDFAELLLDPADLGVRLRRPLRVVVHDPDRRVVPVVE
jgi:hypothetical protein